MKNAGIDYGKGLTNINRETGIRYGVISQNEVLQAWSDSSEPYYIKACPYCGNELSESLYNDVLSGMGKECSHCKKALTEFDFQDQEPSSYYLDDGKYMAECGDDGDIFVTKAPYYTYCKFCSPCAPGAGYLMDYYRPQGKAKEQLTLVRNIAPLSYTQAFISWAENDGYIKAYCLGHDFFDDGNAPYMVFSVATDEEVKP